MDEPNNKEEEYVEEEIEVYEEVEVDEEEETNDLLSQKQKRNDINKKINNETNNENIVNIKRGDKKEGNLNNDKLPLLDDIIQNEIEDNNNLYENVENNNILNNNDINDHKLDMINNFNFNDKTEENKYLNLDYKIVPEKENLELQNNYQALDDYVQKELNSHQNQINGEYKNINSLNNEKNKVNNATHQPSNFRSKIKRNNKKINKFDSNLNRDNNINNNCQINKQNIEPFLNNNIFKSSK